MENSVEVPQKIKNRIIMQSSSSTPQIQQYLSETKEKTNTSSKRYLYPYVQYSFIYNTWDMEAT